MAQQLAGIKQSKMSQPQQVSSQTSDQKGCAEVGSSAQKAIANFQTNQAQGKGPDYMKIGGVAEKACPAYNPIEHAGGEDMKDLEEIARNITAGFCGCSSSKEVDDGTKLDEAEGVISSQVDEGGEYESQLGKAGGKDESALRVTHKETKRGDSLDKAMNQDAVQELPEGKFAQESNTRKNPLVNSSSERSSLDEGKNAQGLTGSQGTRDETLSTRTDDGKPVDDGQRSRITRRE
ncbi:uncharacterized protein CTRU02_205675 [Colletotrichum truncatum]|uniref:Uncharacterized protein n=1 Tax=Colletotrichum truncatum TaxID=5467 RepID=A0ACC3Z4S8_COLTU|nr:uncharacterized protein CTRU02_09429 [Colletotrichum truncatum]KAF6788620.1 hypothetical protein CTRU02_09429 [Colletotrichum truncatum]